ncbi:hypothetical protein [Paenibacillus sp. 22594]
MLDNIGFIIDIGFSYDEIRRINASQSPQKETHALLCNEPGI